MSNWSDVARTCARTCAMVALLMGTALSTAATAEAQGGKTQDKRTKSGEPKAEKPKGEKSDTPDKPDKLKVSKLFKSVSPLSITLTANFKAIRREKQDGAPYHTATITYADSAGKPVSVPLRMRTRGIWRLANCDFPPLRLNFANKTSKHSLLDDLDEPKLVS